jgi:hypothetical protein
MVKRIVYGGEYLVTEFTADEVFAPEDYCAFTGAIQE